MKKKILIIGNGAREYALAKKLSEQNEIFITPETATLKEFATCLDIREDNTTELLDFVMENSIDMTIPISKKALTSNIVEIFNANNQKIFAPDREASSIVFDKVLAKKVLYKLRIPTPKFGIFEKQNMVLDYIKNQKIPFVLKTNDTNSATVLTSYSAAKALVEECYIDKNKRIIIEDYVYGTPFSFYALTDGFKALPIGSSLTYKHRLEGDGGQLTTGMGACAPNYKLTLDKIYFLMDNVIYPTLDYLQIERKPYVGILGVNGILTSDGKLFVLGWHSFMQDADCAAILELLDENIFELCDSCIIGSFSDEVDEIRLNDNFSTSLVLECKNNKNIQNIIQGIDCMDENTVLTFYPYVNKNKYLELEASKGPNLMITTSAATVSKAVNKMYAEANDIVFKGKSFRKDICCLNL